MSIQTKYIAGIDLAVNEDLPASIAVMEYNLKEGAWLLIEVVKIPAGRRGRYSKLKRMINWSLYFKYPDITILYER